MPAAHHVSSALQLQLPVSVNPPTPSFSLSPLSKPQNSNSQSQAVSLVQSHQPPPPTSQQPNKPVQIDTKPSNSFRPFLELSHNPVIHPYNYLINPPEARTYSTPNYMPRDSTTGLLPSRDHHILQRDPGYKTLGHHGIASL